ncbi:MAG: priA [Ilumatobacteraceae bacterium]|nr:priA [Ilumatobacteraceae bacterium]
MSPGPGAADEVLVARVVPDVTGLDKHFDYLVPEAMADAVRPGSQVRVPLHGRRVGGWVIAVGPPDGSVAPDRLLPLAKWSGIGPAPELVELAPWAATRWGTDRLRPFLVAASPPTLVRAVPPPNRTVDPGPTTSSAVHRVPPNTDPLPLVLGAAAGGPLLVLHPTLAAARALANRLRRTGLAVALVPEQWARAAGGVDVVVGTRAGVWAPCPGLATIVVLDEHDESLQEERTPTWHARDVAIERARRAGAACVLVSPSPSVTALEWAGDRFVRPSVAEERASWPLLEVVDRTQEEPWKRSLVTSELIRHLRDPQQRVVCVLNVVGRARLLACRACRNLQRCERCDAAVRQDDAGSFVCARCGTVRPAVCQHCGSMAMANVRPGVSRIREELEAAAARPVVAVTGDSDHVAPADVYVGTEAVLHRVRNTDVVAFLDLDAELLAPRYRAAEQAMALLVRAARLVGPRAAGGRLLVQTFLPHHEVLEAVLHADPTRLAVVETERRRLLGLPPFRALAAVQGNGADELAASTGLEHTTAGTVTLVRGDTWLELGERLAAAPRPPGSRLRVEVDPPRR